MKDWIFCGVMAYSFVATAILWKFGLKQHFGWFCDVCVMGIPLPFAIEKLWTMFNS